MMTLMMKMRMNISGYLCEQRVSHPLSPYFALCVVCRQKGRKYPSKPFAPFLSVCCDFWTAHHFERIKSTSLFAYSALYATDKEKGLLKVEIYIKFRTKNTVGKSRKNKKPKLYLQRIP